MKMVKRVAAAAVASAALGGVMLASASAASASPAPPAPPGSDRCSLTLTTNTGVLGGLEDLLYGGANNWQAYCR
jgi:hypothetical protein